MKSMTGYGEASLQHKEVKVAIQVRSVNHRHSDIHLRLPKIFLSLEQEMREKVRSKIQRGRLDIFVDRLSVKGRPAAELQVDDGLVEQYCLALRRIKNKYRLQGNLDLELLSRLPELFRFSEPQSIDRKEKQLVLRTLDKALNSLVRSREREGRHLKRDMRGQQRQLRRVANSLERCAREIDARLRPARPASFALENSGSSESSDSAVLKGSINEEVVRLDSHVGALAFLLQERDPVGKRIDFLLQEIQRELTTIGAKAPDLPVIQWVLKGKESVEKIREQVQNVE